VNGWRQRLAKVSLPALFVYFAGTFGLGTWLLGLLTSTTTSWRGHLMGDLFFGVLMTGVTAWQRRRNGGVEAQLETTKGLKAGQLPPEADPQVWRARLDRQERTHRRVRVIAPIEFGAFSVLAVWLALDQGVIWWAFAALFVLIGAGCAVASTRTLRRIDVLREELLHR
jgi:hypothetical protein